MKQKNLAILIVIFVFLITLAYVKKNVKPDALMTEETVDIIQPSVRLAELSEISLMLGVLQEEEGAKVNPNFIRMVKENDHWTVATQHGVLANEKTIAPVLDKIDELKGELRSSRGNLLADYGIDNIQAFHIRLKRNDGQIIKILVGSKKSGYQDNFIRLEGSNAVYIVNENILSAFGIRGEGDEQKLDATKWADKRLTHMEVNDIKAVSISEIVDGNEVKVIDLKQEIGDGKKQWKSVIPHEFGLSAAKIKKIAENFNNTYAMDVVAPNAEGVFDSPGWITSMVITL